MTPYLSSTHKWPIVEGQISCTRVWAPDYRGPVAFCGAGQVNFLAVLTRVEPIPGFTTAGEPMETYRWHFDHVVDLTETAAPAPVKGKHLKAPGAITCSLPDADYFTGGPFKPLPPAVENLLPPYPAMACGLCGDVKVPRWVKWYGAAICPGCEAMGDE
jgi:hypothetical protein